MVRYSPTLLFVAAFALKVTPHEAAHAVAAYLLGFSSTLFQMWVNPDAETASSRPVVAIATAGPIFSLAVGGITWLLYKFRYNRSLADLIFLMLAVLGIYSFLDPVTGAAFGGDFNIALRSTGADPTLVALQSMHVDVETKGEFTRGETVANRRGSDENNVLHGEHYEIEGVVDLKAWPHSGRFVRMFVSRITPH